VEWVSAYGKGKRKFVPVRTVKGYVGVEVQNHSFLITECC